VFGLLSLQLRTPLNHLAPQPLHRLTGYSQIDRGVKPGRLQQVLLLKISQPVFMLLMNKIL
jgi:hypothetical protein